MASLTQVTLQLIVKKLDEILKILKLGRRSSNRNEKKEDKSVSEEKFITAMHNVMNWVNKKDDKI